MYQNRYSGASRRNNKQGYRGYNKQRQARRRWSGNGGGRRFGKKINPALYVKRAEEIVKIEDIQTKNMFADFGFRPELLANIKSKGYIKPTQIQDEAIPFVMQGRDVLGLAETGTGKTAAFCLPMINKILKDPRQRMIIITPTRELAMQIKQEIRSFTCNLRVYLALAIGGANIGRQISEIKRGPHIIIGTPGRIMDLGRRNVIDFGSMTTLVLDEVDRMLDMGFVDDIRLIVDKIPTYRQTLFFSATIDRRVEGLIGSFLKNPTKISIKTSSASTHVEQNIVKVPRYAKEQKLCELVQSPDFKKVLVFGSTRMIVERLSLSLSQKGMRASGLHGGKRQNQRQAIMRDFKENRVKVLVATDVAARGLDIIDITHVINYDEPASYQDYIHRIGRTGRGNRKGYALTFIE